MELEFLSFPLPLFIGQAVSQSTSIYNRHLPSVTKQQEVLTNPGQFLESGFCCFLGLTTLMPHKEEKVNVPEKKMLQSAASDANVL